MEIDRSGKNRDHSPEFEDVDFYEEEREQKEPGIQVIGFRLGREWFAVEIERVMEVIRGGRITDVPSAPHYIVGIHNLRGNIVSITDPKRLFELEGAPEVDRGRIIVIGTGEAETGLIVDEVSRVIDVNQTSIDPPLSTLSSEKAQYVKGEFRVGGRLITLLDTEVVIEKTKNINEGSQKF